ncbi:MAG: hypothetical protein H0T76_23785 [Nannocystis sp.]|nr:hypothetical protein [Nannocystis sp.]MBA3549508.1 hypothetical protein [Nannocystis sp.]
MDLGAKGRSSSVTLTAFILLLAPACAQGVALDDSATATATVTATGTGSTAADTGATEPGTSSGEPDDTGATEATSSGGEESSSSGDESSGGETTTGEPLDNPELYPFGLVHSPISMAVAANMRAIATSVPGKNPAAFTRVGDTIAASASFLQCFATDDGFLMLPPEVSLTATINHFRTDLGGGTNSWNHVSAAATAGWMSDALVTGLPTPVGNEVAMILPGFAHVMSGTHDLEKDGPEALWTFADNLLAVVDQLTTNGVVPVLSTIPQRPDKPLLIPRFNGVIRAIAQGRQIPLLDLNFALSKLPMTGLVDMGIDLSVFTSVDVPRPCHFTEAALQFGYNVHNLESLRALDRARQVVVEMTAFLGAPPPKLMGVGTAKNPIVVPSLPFVDFRSTADSASDNIDNYGGTCDGAVVQTGPERFYRLDVKDPVTVRAMVFGRSPVNVDLHVLTGLTPDTCVKRDEQEITGPLPPGTYYLVVDTDGDLVAGDYALVILPE